MTRVGCGFNGLKDAVAAQMFKPALALKNVYLPQSFILELFDERNDGIKTPSDLVPSTNNGVREFPKDLEKRLSLYIKWLRDNCTNGYELKLWDDVESICNNIVKAVNNTYRGLPSEAFSCIYGILTQDKTLLLDNNIIEVEVSDFYRMRTEQDNWKKKEIDRKDMFHLPFSMRDSVKTQRYSMPGYPCLYLSKRIIGCWEELGRPNIDNCLISKFKNKKAIKVLDLSFHVDKQWESPVDDNLIKFFPFVIASTFKSSNTNATFKPEYIVPQLILQCLRKYAEKHKKEDVIYGIKYTSVNVPKNEDIENYDNYVIPVVDIQNDYCAELTELFSLTKPYCEETARGTGVGLGKEDITTGNIFERIESILQDEKEFPLDRLS